MNIIVYANCSPVLSHIIQSYLSNHTSPPIIELHQEPLEMRPKRRIAVQPQGLLVRLIVSTTIGIVVAIVAGVVGSAGTPVGTPTMHYDDWVLSISIEFGSTGATRKLMRIRQRIGPNNLQPVTPP
jgi:hypothetical protein